MRRIFILSLLLLLAGCFSEKKKDHQTKVHFDFAPSLSSVTKSESGKVITIDQIKQIVVGYDHPNRGNSAFLLPTGSMSGSYSMPNGNLLIYSLLYANGTRTTPEGVVQNSLIYYDSQNHFLGNYELYVHLNLLPVHQSPYRSRGTITLKNEAGVVVSNQKIVVNHNSWKTTPPLYSLTTDREGVFTIDSFVQGQPYIIQVIDSQNVVLKEVTFKTPLLSTFSQEVRYEITAAYCQTLGQSNCNIPGCVWNNGTCQSQSLITCSDFNQANCAQNPACFWDYATSSCIKTYNVSCLGKPLADCTGVCMVLGGICVNMGVSSCSSFITMPTCMPPCTWNPTQNLCTNAMLTNCSTATTETACLQNGACLWSSSTSTCQNKLSQDCTSLTTQNNCLSDARCFWDNFTATCKNSMAVSCSEHTTQVNCQSDSACMWNYQQNVCLNSISINCYNNVTMATCSTSPGCVWDYTTLTCKNAMSYDCETNLSNATCLSSPSCYWDPATSLCKRILAVDCTSHVTHATCITETACDWNYTTMTCINKLAVDCISKTSMADCQNSSNCTWINSTNSCQNTASVSCSQYSQQVDCASNSACTWDYAYNYCKNASTVMCSSFMTMATCQSQSSCLWDYGTNLCVNSTSLSCSQHITQPTCITQSGCMWNGSSCQNATANSCSNYNSEAQCISDSSNGCFWHLSYVGATTGNCYNKYTFDCSGLWTKVSCEEFQACSWHRTNLNCQNTHNLYCSTYTDQAQCDNARNGCYYSASLCKKSVTEGGCLSYHNNQTGCTSLGSGDCTYDTVFKYCAPVVNALTCASYTGSGQSICETHSDCFWNSITSACTNRSGYNCSPHVTKPTCEQSLGCYWNNLYNSCENATDVSCNNLSETACNNNAPGCFFYNGICYKSSINGCNSYHRRMAQCNSAVPSNQGPCSYNNSSEYCSKDLTSTSCTSYGANSSGCISNSNCFWSQNDFACYDKNSFDCTNKVPKSYCERYFGCFWNSSNNLCQNAQNVTCAGLNETDCNQKKSGCYYHNGICHKSIVSGCLSFHNNPSNCTALQIPTPGICSYDFSYNYCSMNVGASTCSSFASPATCDASPACFWSNAPSGCYDKVNFDCAAYGGGNKNICEQYRACYFKTISSSCQNAYSLNCSGYDFTTCNQYSPGCFYDGGICRKSVEVGCLSYHKMENSCNSATTQNQGPCVFNNSYQYCGKP